MKFALAKEHHDFFDKNGFIEFEELIPASALEKMSKAVRRQVGIRLNRLPERLIHESPEALFLAGRDLWRDLPELKRQEAGRNFSGVAAALVRQMAIRLGLDQWIPAGVVWNEGMTVEQMVPFQGVLSAAFIALDSSHHENEPVFFPTRAGNVLFVRADREIPFGELTKERNQSFLMVVYCNRNAVYVHKKSDPLTHFLIGLDYVYGDRLSDHLHPLILF